MSLVNIGWASDRVNIFWEKSSDGIALLHFSESFENEGRASELTAHNTALAHILKDAPIATFAESFVCPLFGVFAVYIKPVLFAYPLDSKTSVFFFLYSIIII